MAMSVSSEMTFFSMKLQSAICPQLRTNTRVHPNQEKKKRQKREGKDQEGFHTQPRMGELAIITPPTFEMQTAQKEEVKTKKCLPFHT